MEELVQPPVPFFCILAIGDTSQEGSESSEGFSGEGLTEVSFQVEEIDLVIGIGEEVLDDFMDSSEVVGDEEEDSVNTTLEEVLEDFHLESFTFPNPFGYRARGFR